MERLIKILLTISIITGILMTATAITIKSVDKTETGISINFFNGNKYTIEKAVKETQPELKVSNVLYKSTDNFHLDDGDIGIEFSDGITFAVANLETNTYAFQPAELGDWDLTFDNLKDFENCIKTYISIKNTGSY